MIAELELLGWALAAAIALFNAAIFGVKKLNEYKRSKSDPPPPKSTAKAQTDTGTHVQIATIEDVERHVAAVHARVAELDQHMHAELGDIRANMVTANQFGDVQTDVREIRQLLIRDLQSRR